MGEAVGRNNSYEEDSNRFPADKEFKEAFNQSYLYNKYAREILFIIALYKISNKYSDVKKLSLESHSVEHMMPKKWAGSAFVWGLRWGASPQTPPRFRPVFQQLVVLFIEM